MPRWKAVAAAALTAVLVAAASPAQAQRVTVADAAGDNVGPGLDITSVSIRNRDHAILATLTFTRDRRSEVIVFVKARGGPLVGVVSEHPRQGPDSTFLIGGDENDPLCRGLRSVWDRSVATVTMRLPSRCLAFGDYGAVRSLILIETFRGARDVDYAPEKPNGEPAYSDWVPRG